MTAWYDDPIFQGNAYATTYKGPGTDTPHYAYDMQTPFHTPLTAPTSGTVKVADYQAWGGEIFVQPDNTSLPEWYFYHPDEVDVHVGQHVNAGQVIALSGGENPGYPGAEHPAQPQWSSGPHTHVGWFTKWVTPPETGSTIPYGPDPANLLQMAKGGGGGTFNVPDAIYKDVEPIAHAQSVPDSIWETVASVESGFNPTNIGDNGTSFGLFQLHQGGQLGNLTESQAMDPTTNAKTAMPSIASAWKALSSTFDGSSLSWWEQFAATSGHPAENGNTNDPAVIAEAQKLQTTYEGSGDSTTSSSSTSTGNPLTDITNLLTTQAKPFAMRVGVGIIGVGLVFLGVMEITRALGEQTGVSNAVTKVAKVAAL